MKRDLLDLASSLTRRGVSFVMATVVRREGATPAHLGDMALVTGDGAVHGWIGNAEIRSVIEREAMRALTERRPSLICLSTSPDREPRSGVLQLQLPLDSEGMLEVYLAPVVSSPRLLLIGRSPILAALAILGRTIGYRIDRVVPDPRPEDSLATDRVFRECDDPRLLESDGIPLLVVVAPAGDRDVEVIAAAMAMAPAYLAVLASRRRFTLLRDALVNRGLTAAVDRIANPAGLALGAHDPGEVAVGILAQMIARRNGVLAVNEASVTLSEASEVTSTMDVVVDPDAERAPAGEPPGGNASATASCFPVPARQGEDGGTVALRVRASSPSMETRSAAALGTPTTSSPPFAPASALPGAAPTTPSDGTPVPVGMSEAIDPVCQASVALADARNVGRWQGRSWYFCSGECRARFFANPLRYSAFAPGVPEPT